MRSRFALLPLAAALLAASPSFAQTPEPRALTLGPVPRECGELGKDYADSSCLAQTYSHISVSPHVVHAGGTVTATVALDQVSNRNVEWRGIVGIAPGFNGPQMWPNLKVARGCTDTSTTCTWRIPRNAQTSPWLIVEAATHYATGTGISKDYFAIVGAGRFLLAGHVVDQHGKRMAGVPIRIRGNGVNFTRRTDATGGYNAVLPRGRYVVSSERKGMRPVRTKDCTPAGATCHVNLIQDRTADFEIAAPALVFTAELGAKVRSQRHPSLIEAGTPFLVRVTLRNTSRTQRLRVWPIWGDLSGNAADGHLQPTGMPVRRFTPTGALEEVGLSPQIVLAPKQTREFDVVVRTSPSDPYAILPGESRSGGSRAVVRFAPPEIATLDADNTETKLDPRKNVEMTKGSDEIVVGVDDSTLEPPPFSWYEAEWSVTKGFYMGLWRATWGTVRGLAWDLPRAVLGGIASIPQYSLAYVQYEAEMWDAIKDDPQAVADFLDPVQHYVQLAYRETPWLLGQAGDLKTKINDAIYRNYSKMWGDWFAGDWRDALTDMTAEGTDQAVNVALAVAPGVLARLPKVREAYVAAKTAMYARVSDALLPIVKPLTTAAEASGALKNVMKAGYLLADSHLEKLFGVSGEQAAWLRQFAKAKRLLITFRSRAQSSLKWLQEGAVLKPFWIKIKTVGWLDVKYLGYEAGDIGRVVLRKPVSRREFYERIFPRIPVGERAEVAKRWFMRSQEWESKEKGMGQKMFEWSANKEVEGKWPWSENLMDPMAHADEITKTPLQLVRRADRPGEYLVQVWNKKTNKWASVTGDVDFLSITEANGAPISEARRIQILNEMRDGPVGLMHPESATWKAPKPIRDKYSGFKDGVCCEAQVGADGRVRAVVYRANMSWFKNPLKYQVWYDGGYVMPNPPF